MSENVALYYFSTYAQSVAALVGLSAAFAIYYYQNLRAYCIEKAAKIHAAFAGSFRAFLSDAEKSKFRDMVNHDLRAVYVEPIYRTWLDHSKRDQVTNKFNGDRGKIEEFYAWQDEFTDLNDAKEKMISFRKIFLFSSGVGLTLIFCSILALILTTNNGAVSQRCTIAAVFALGLFFYLATVFKMLHLSLERPLSKCEPSATNLVQ